MALEYTIRFYDSFGRSEWFNVIFDNLSSQETAGHSDDMFLFFFFLLVSFDTWKSTRTTPFLILDWPSDRRLFSDLSTVLATIPLPLFTFNVPLSVSLGNFRLSTWPDIILYIWYNPLFSPCNCQAIDWEGSVCSRIRRNSCWRVWTLTRSFICIFTFSCFLSWAFSSFTVFFLLNIRLFHPSHCLVIISFSYLKVASFNVPVCSLIPFFTILYSFLSSSIFAQHEKRVFDSIYELCRSFQK